MATFMVKAREIRTRLAGQKGLDGFIHPSGKVIEMDANDPRVEYYKKQGAIAAVRRKGAKDSGEEEE